MESVGRNVETMKKISCFSSKIAPDVGFIADSCLTWSYEDSKIVIFLLNLYLNFYQVPLPSLLIQKTSLLSCLRVFVCMHVFIYSSTYYKMNFRFFLLVYNSSMYLIFITIPVLTSGNSLAGFSIRVQWLHLLLLKCILYFQEQHYAPGMLCTYASTLGSNNWGVLAHRCTSEISLVVLTDS